MRSKAQALASLILALSLTLFSISYAAPSHIGKWSQTIGEGAMLLNFAAEVRERS